MSRNIKSSVAYAAVSAFAFIFNKIYSIFSHGVASAAMAEMWIWLLILGSLFYLILETLFYQNSPRSASITGTRLYNSGVAIVVVGMLIQGIVEIAGTGSDFLSFYRIAGGAFMCIGGIITLKKAFADRKKLKVK